MMVYTERLALPLLAAGQAQKELTHNEALSLLDLVVAMTAESADVTTPPAVPDLGQCWIVADGGTGAWTDRDRWLAGWTANGWRFLAPFEGMRCWVKDRGNGLCHDGEDWIDDAVREDGYYVSGQRVVGARGEGITSPSGGATQDAEARAAINAVLAALREHGLIEA
jgi:hypothetical protein